MRTKITNTEIVAVVEGNADTLTERRVLAAALHDVGVRQRLALLKAVAAETEPLPRLSAALQTQLQENLAIAARRVGREYAERQRAGSDSASLPGWLETFTGTVRRVLTLEKHRFGLSALAPALAASVAPLSVQREVVEAQKVRLEVHQLPDSPTRLRFYVDASASPEFLSEEVTGVALALQEEGNLELQILIVPVNAQGRGALEILAPAVQGGVSLLGVALVTA
ncbi:hypothetical protein [Armatimonas sp.]|uniref:hypothetical protein n=1 Tax=Armatimonas sp. TaxID=1872638 RepID=UPI0037501DB2